MALSIEARELFLAEPQVAALSVVAGPDEGPLAMIWYQYAAGGDLWVLTPARVAEGRPHPGLGSAGGLEGLRYRQCGQRTG